MPHKHAILLALLASVLAGCPEPTTKPPAATRLQAATQTPQQLVGKVVGVHDGDTITVLVDRAEHKVRLHGIDCPELGQPFGRQAKQLTSRLARVEQVTVDVKDRDRYGRLVGVVTLPTGSSLNHALVEAGLAWWYQRYAFGDAKLEGLEEAARKAEIGLWSQPEPVPPWEWRRGGR